MPFFTSNGVNIYVDRAGGGTPLLLLHGLTLDHRQWEAQRDAWSNTCEVFRVDLRGHGRSATTATGHTFTGFAEDARRALVQLGIDRLHPGFVVGHSVSADTALQLALLEPRAIRGVVVVAPAVWGQSWSKDWREMFRDMRAAAAQGNLDRALARFRKDAIFDGVRAQPDLQRAVVEMQRAFSGAYLATREKDEGTPTLERLEHCKTPILVLRPQNDRADFRAAATAVAERAARAHVVECADVGHFPNLEDPEGFNREVMEFVAEHA